MEKLAGIFPELCREMTVKLDPMYAEQAHQKQMHTFSMYFRMIRVELVYSQKWEVLAPPSVLYARIYLNKNLPVYLHLPELIALLGKNDYRACYFPYIESEQRMRDCLECLLEILATYIPIAEKLSASGEASAIMDRWVNEGFFEKEEEQETSDEKINWDTILDIRKFQESAIVNRFTIFTGYDAFLTGNREKAIREYEKLGADGRFHYETGLLQFLQSGAADNFVPMPLRCYCAGQYKKSEKIDKTDLKGFALLYIVLAAVFCGLIAVVNGILSADTLYFYGVQWWYGFLLATITTMFGYLAVQQYLRPKLGGDAAFYQVGKSDRFARKLATACFAVCFVGSVVFCIALPQMSSRYYDTYMIYYTEEEKSERFEYAQVVEVCYISARYNVYDERVERASYVLIFADGRQVDLDCDGSVEKQREMIDRLFPAVPIRELDSDRDLPDKYQQSG